MQTSCSRTSPREHLATFFDVFVDSTAFTIDESRVMLAAAAAVGLKTKLHVDQLSDDGGAQLAADVGATSADHLEHVSDDGIQALAGSGTVAVSLPIATLYLGQPPIPARKLLDAGVPVAVATDFNPGSAPSFHLPWAMNLSCTLQRMTPTEALPRCDTSCRQGAESRGRYRIDRVGQVSRSRCA